MRLDSQEQIKKPKTVQKIKNQGKKDLDKIKKSKKTCQIKLFLSIFIFILVATIAILLFFLIKNKKKSKASEIKSDSGSLNKETLL
jgi:flagellar basal body-associated protein FliL